MTESQLISLFTSFRSKIAEDECVEFKEAKSNYDFNKLGKYFSALSNEANLKSKTFAWLIFGVKDTPLPRPIVGTTYRSKRADLDSLKGEIAQQTSNRITFDEIYELSLPEGRVILFQIPAAPKGMPIAWKGHYYGRDGEELGPLNMVEIEKIRRQAIHFDWSAQVVPGAAIEDLDPQAITKAREEYLTKNPRQSTSMKKWDDLTFLNKAKITIRGKITRTALLLLGKEESTHFLNPSVARISWILKDQDNFEKDYEHFGPPFLLNTTMIFSKIRNLTYRYLKDATLFPTEIKTYEPYVIREALHNCIAHQDYLLQGRILVIEKPEELIFSNPGSFLPGSVDTVIEQDAPQQFYRNTFLAEAMVNLNMIDTIGSGIKRMFIEQRNRFFPLPDYDLSSPRKVVVRIPGSIGDENYTRMLINNTDLSLKTVILLDKVQKSIPLDEGEIKKLRKLGLIEGRKPNLFVAAKVAKATGRKVDYIRNSGFDNQYYRDMVLEYIKQFKEATRNEIEGLLLEKLPDVLSEQQKKDKVKNILQWLKSNGKIELTTGKKWVLVNASSSTLDEL